MAAKINLSKAFDHPDVEEGQKLFNKIMTPEVHQKMAQHVSNHLLGKMPKETGMAFDNPNQESENEIGHFPPAAPKAKKSVVRRKAKGLDEDQWRSSPQASGGDQGETGVSTGLP